MSSAAVYNAECGKLRNTAVESNPDPILHLYFAYHIIPVPIILTYHYPSLFGSNCLQFGLEYILLMI